MNTDKRKTVDIIVPCYNEEDVLDKFYKELLDVIDDIDGYDFRCIFVDDGSTDSTLEIIKEMVQRADSRMPEAPATSETPAFAVKYISFSRNFGKEAAMYAGLRTARENNSDLAVIIDADLQHPPKLIKEMLKIIEEKGCDSCAARRVTRKGEPKIRSALARTFYKIMNHYSDIEIVDGAVDFRMMNRKMIRAIVGMPENQRFSKGIFAWVGFDTEWIEFENVKRISGESKWSLWSLIKYAADGFIDFAASPLRFLGVFGGITTAGSAVYIIIEILKTLVMGKDTPGYASTICLILFFGGLITAILSIMGEYIGRMYMETKNRPIYIEKESNIDEDQKIPCRK